HRGGHGRSRDGTGRKETGHRNDAVRGEGQPLGSGVSVGAGAGSGLQRGLLSEPQMETVVALVAASQLQHTPPRASTSAECPANRGPEWPVETRARQRAEPQTTFIPPSTPSARRARDVIFEKWDESMTDVLPWNIGCNVGSSGSGVRAKLGDRFFSVLLVPL